MTTKKECWVCEGKENVYFGLKCKKHDVCDVCKRPGAEIPETHWMTKTGFICDPCLRAKQAKAISDFEKEKHYECEFNYNDYVKCPYCGHEYNPDELYESTEDEECGKCGSIMSVEVDHLVMYTTSKLNNEASK